MLSTYEAARKFAAEEAAALAEARALVQAGEAEQMAQADQGQVPTPLVPAPWQEASQAQRADGPAAGKSPAEILRRLQVRQMATVITEVMPGPEAWAPYETPLPGGLQDQQFQAVKGDTPLTPGHSAAEGAVNGAEHGEASEADRRRQRIQHEVDPVDVPEVDCAELGKRYRQAYEVLPSEYPPFRPVAAEEFRRPPGAGPATDGSGCGMPGRPVPVPTATLSAAMITRPVLTEGQGRPVAPGAA